jgi:hypothetical protein
MWLFVFEVDIAKRQRQRNDKETMTTASNVMYMALGGGAAA